MTHSITVTTVATKRTKTCRAPYLVALGVEELQQEAAKDVAKVDAEFSALRLSGFSCRNRKVTKAFYSPFILSTLVCHSPNQEKPNCHYLHPFLVGIGCYLLGLVSSHCAEEGAVLDAAVRAICNWGPKKDISISKDRNIPTFLGFIIRGIMWAVPILIFACLCAFLGPCICASWVDLGSQRV